MSTLPPDHEKRVEDADRAAQLAEVLIGRERWPRPQLEVLQQERLDALVRHAGSESPYYRERLAGLIGDSPVALAALPTLDKQTLMDRFDEIVCDRRLRRDDLLEHLELGGIDPLYLGEYRAMCTSGSSGRKGLFVYDREDWAVYVAQFLRFTAFAGFPPGRTRGLRVAFVAGSAPTHVGARVAMTCAAGALFSVHPFPATLPMGRIVEGLNEMQPDVLHAFASLAPLIADEQLAGRLRIAPRVVTTGAELLTPEMASRVEQAFGVEPYDFYSCTEGLFSSHCEHHVGFHLFEDLTIVENVNEDGQPVSAGQPGARVLLTNLFNRTQPLIRYELADVITIDPDPCPCGRTLRRVRSVEGRSDDVLRLGGTMLHPLQFAALTADRAVREFQVVQHGERLSLRVVLRDGAPVAETSGRLRDTVSQRLREAGVEQPQVTVETCDAIDRPPGGKLQLVVADPAAALRSPPPAAAPAAPR